MAAIEIIEAFEKEYFPMDFFCNQQSASHFTKGWCAAKAAEAQKTSHNSDYAKCKEALRRMLKAAYDADRQGKLFDSFDSALLDMAKEALR